MQRNPHSYQIATGYRTFYSLSLIYQPITKKRLFFYNKQLIGTLNSYICFFNETDKIFTAVICYEIDGVFFV